MTDPYDKIAFHMEIEKAIGGQIDFPIADLLTAAGYRILAPGEIDPVTLERCAEVADQAEQPGIPGSSEWITLGNFAGAIAAAIRALSGDGQ